MKFSDGWAYIYKAYPEFINSDFVIGEDNFSDIQIDNSKNNNDFWYFKNIKKGLIKRFILQRTGQVEKVCVVTLVKKDNGRFTPRFDLQIWNTTRKAYENFSKENIDQNLIKAKVDLNSCYENFSLLIGFIKEIENIEFDSPHYSVVEKSKKDIFDNITKDTAISSLKEKYGSEISEDDISLLQDRRAKLIVFNKLLNDKNFFNEEKKNLGKIRDEDLWQYFFEKNQWIFGYGLQLIACEGLEGKKMEQTVVGHDIVNGSGKRIDALLKTKGSISKMLFCEIKTPSPDLLIEEYDRPGVFVPAKELRGAVAQIQKTIHKITLTLQQNFCRITVKNGDPSGEEILFVKPRGIIVIGRLDDFKTDKGINYEKLSSFELYRQQINGIEIVTFDELYERARFIVEK